MTPLAIAAATTATMLAGCEKPAPVRVVAFLDASGSSVALRPRMIDFLKDFVHRLDRHMDKLVVYQMANKVSQIYVGEAYSGPALEDNLNAYVKSPAAPGTSYGMALEKAVTEAGYATSEKRIPVILLLGDGQDEPGPGVVNMDAKKIPAIAKKLGPKALVSFVFVTPTERFSRAFEAFQAGFGANYDERLQFTTPESEEKHAARRFLTERLRR